MRNDIHLDTLLMVKKRSVTGMLYFIRLKYLPFILVVGVMG
jgi:hypothetical protein